MTVSGSATGFDSRIGRALLWLVRVLLGILAISALLRGGDQGLRDGLVLLGVLVAHIVAHYAVRRLDFPWLATGVDLVLAGLAFYLTGGASQYIASQPLGLWRTLPLLG